MDRIVFIVLAVAAAVPAWAAEAPLVLRDKIPLGMVRGTLGHMSMDRVRGRLLLAETHNDTVSVIDLQQRAVIQRLSGFNLPLDVDYVGKVQTFVADTIYVSGGGDGKLRYFDGADFSPTGQIELSGEAEDIIVDAQNDHLLVGHGDGGITIIDASGPRKLSTTPLGAHPEDFVIDTNGNRILAALPARNVVAVMERASAKPMTEWKVGGAGQFNALAITPSSLLLASQTPAKLMSVRLTDGQLTGATDSCAEADDILLDAARNRVYLVCGDGNIDVFQLDPAGAGAPVRTSRIATSPQARTGLIDPAAGRIYVAVPTKGDAPAAVWIYDIR